jgi:hypothetical protein
LEANGLEPKRVDKHNEGGLLKSEIIEFIATSDIIVADLTNERPNCYLEVGYTMGIGKFKNLILTSREDHSQDSPNHRHGGPKVHFDLSGYEIVFWHPERLNDFRESLRKLVKRRLQNLTSNNNLESEQWDREWLNKHQGLALAGIQQAKKTVNPGYMEVLHGIQGMKPSKNLNELLKAMQASQVQGSGWPIGVVMNREECRPRPKGDEIVAEVCGQDGKMYDYWALRGNGDFYFLESLVEEPNRPGSMLYDSRVRRIAEVILHCRKLYATLEVPDTARVFISVWHRGLRERKLSFGGPLATIHWENRLSSENEVEANISERIGNLEPRLIDLVKELTEGLFMNFDFFELSDAGYAEIVNDLLQELSV